MKVMSGADVREMREEIEAAIKQILEPRGIAVNVSRARYDNNSFTVSVDASLKQIVDGEEVTPEGAAFKRLAHSYGLEPEMLNRCYSHPRQGMYRVVGLKASRPKYPIQLIRVSDGARIKAPAEFVQAMAIYPVAEPKPKQTQGPKSPVDFGIKNDLRDSAGW